MWMGEQPGALQTAIDFATLNQTDLISSPKNR